MTDTVDNSAASEPQSGRRVLLKLSGEALMGDRAYGIDPIYVQRIAREIKSVIHEGVQVCLVVGGGNIFRGVSGAAAGMDRAAADQMGMLATVINALALKNALDDAGVDSRVQSAIPWTTSVSRLFAIVRSATCRRVAP